MLNPEDIEFKLQGDTVLIRRPKLRPYQGSSNLYKGKALEYKEGVELMKRPYKVIAIGEDCTDIKIGDYVFLYPHMYQIKGEFDARHYAINDEDSALILSETGDIMGVSYYPEKWEEEDKIIEEQTKEKEKDNEELRKSYSKFAP